MKILIINGVNLNFLGIREQNIYGSQTLENLENELKIYVENLNEENTNNNKRKLTIEFFQSNHEGEIVDRIQKAYFEKIQGIVINPGAHTHYSYAIFDAIKGSQIPTIEVHLSDITKREEFRKTSVIEPACIKQFKGEGITSYTNAINYLSTTA